MAREVFVLKQGDTREPIELQFTLEKKGMPPSDWPPMNCEDAQTPRFFMRPAGWPDLVRSMPPPLGLTGIAGPDGELPAGTYYYRVAPLRPQGTLELYDEAAPTPEVQVVVGAPGRVTLGWVPPGNATAFRIYRATTPGGPYTTYVTGQSRSRFVDTGMPGTPGAPIAAKIAADGEWISAPNGTARYRWEPRT